MVSLEHKTVSSFNPDVPSDDVHYYGLEYDGHHGSLGYYEDSPRFKTGDRIPVVYLESDPEVFREGHPGDSAWDLCGCPGGE